MENTKLIHIAIDFEYHTIPVTEAIDHLYCVTLHSETGAEKRYWLSDGRDTKQFIKDINRMKRDSGYVLVCHAMEAALTDTDTMNLQRLADEVFEFGDDFECDPSELYDAYKNEAKRFGLPEDNQYYGSRVKAFLVNNGLILTKRTTKREHGAIVHVPPRAFGVRPKSGCTADGVVK